MPGGQPVAGSPPPSRGAAGPSGENVDFVETDADEPADASPRLEAGVQGEADDREDGQDDRAVVSDFLGLFGGDVRQAIAHLIERHWNKADAFQWLAAEVERDQAAAKPPEGPWPPAIACGEVPAWEKARPGQYVTWGPSRVMVVAEVGTAEVVLEDPFYPRGRYPIPVSGDQWDQVRATTEDRVRNEFARIGRDLPGDQSGSRRWRRQGRAPREKNCSEGRRKETPANSRRHEGVDLNPVQLL